MEATIQKNPPNIDRYLYHPALIKLIELIVVEELRKLNLSWDNFLERNGSQEIVVVMVNPLITGNLETLITENEEGLQKRRNTLQVEQYLYN